MIMKLIKCAGILLLAFSLQQCSYSQSSPNTQKTKMETDKKNNPVYSRSDSSKVNLSEDEWKKILPGEIYSIARLKGTERAWTSKYEKFDEVCTYYCAACGNPLFRSDTKRSRSLYP